MIFILIIIGLLDLNVSFSTEFVEEFPSELQPDPSTMQELSSYINLAASKRNVEVRTGTRCEIHKYTLSELYNIVKEETRKFESCLIQFSEPNMLGFFKRSQLSNGCKAQRQTLLELFQIVKTEAEIYENCLEETQIH